MKFSLVTTCRNEMSSLPRWKKDLFAQTRQPDEIVVVDAFSDDGTADMLLEWADHDPRVIVEQKKGSAAHGRNVAVEMASHDHILSTDMGVRLCPVWCEELIKPFEKDSSVEVVAGSTQIDKETVRSAAARAEYYIENGGEPKLGPGFVPGNRSMAYTKKVWRELGGLPEDLTFYADDSVFGRQIVEGGYNVAYAPKAMTYWGRPRKLGQFWRETFNYGRGDGEAMIKMPYSFKLYLKGVPTCLVAPLTGLRVMQKQCKLPAIIRAISRFDLPALFMMPILTFGKGWNFGKGYLVGYAHGNEHCVECRKRLTRSV